MKNEQKFPEALFLEASNKWNNFAFYEILFYLEPKYEVVWGSSNRTTDEQKLTIFSYFVRLFQK